MKCYPSLITLKHGLFLQQLKTNYFIHRFHISDDFAVSSHPAKKQKSSKTDETAKKSNKSVKEKSLNLDRDVVKKHEITSSQNSAKAR